MYGIIEDNDEQEADAHQSTLRHHRTENEADASALIVNGADPRSRERLRQSQSASGTPPRWKGETCQRKRK